MKSISSSTLVCDQRTSSYPRSAFRAFKLAILAAALPAANLTAATIDGILEVGDGYGSALAVQSTTSNWGDSNALARFHAVQEGNSLNVHVAGRANGNAIILFLDTKPGGRNFIPTNTISSGGDEFRINNLGASTSAGMTFETGFEADFAVRIAGTGNDAFANVYDLTTGVGTYAGNAGDAINFPDGATATFMTIARAVWADVAPANYAAATSGVEMKLNFAAMGVPNGAGDIKMMAFLINGNSDFASNQVLATRENNDDIGGARNTIDFQTETGIQSITVGATTDYDLDGIGDDVDTDDDNDGLLDTVESNTGIFVDAGDTGSSPINADTDGDGFTDNHEANGTSALGFVSDPNKKNFPEMAVAGEFNGWDADGNSGNAMIRKGSSLADQNAWALDFYLYDVAPGADLEYKFAAGSFDNNWGTSGSPGVASFNGLNLAHSLAASGIHNFQFDNQSLAYSVTRVTFPSEGAYLAAYGLASGAVDDDGDNLSNSQEYTLNTDPTKVDTDRDGSNDDIDAFPLIPQSRNVTFRVNMTVQEALGNFNPATDNVVVKVFSGVLHPIADIPMTDANDDGIYESAEIPVPGLEGTSFGEYKFFNDAPDAPGFGYEEIFPNRTFTFSANGVAMTVPEPVAFFSNNSTMPDGFNTWAGAGGYNLAPLDGRNDDPDGDGFTNLQEFLFGSVPNAPSSSLVKVGNGSGAMILTWLQRTTGSTYTLVENDDLGTTWAPSAVVPVVSGDQSGVPSGYTRMQATIPTNVDPKKFLRIKGEE